MKNIRVQRKREKGWRMPEDTIYVGRPTKWGNPFLLMGDMIYIDAGYRRKIFSKWVLLCQGDAEECVRLYELVLTGTMKPGKYGLKMGGLYDIAYWVQHFKKLDISELRGKNLSCFCALLNPCHADVLLRYANKNI